MANEDQGFRSRLSVEEAVRVATERTNKFESAINKFFVSKPRILKSGVYVLQVVFLNT